MDSEELDSAESDSEIDQYDSVLRAMWEGLLISVNNEAGRSLEATPSGELRVEHSSDNDTLVMLSGHSDQNYQIHRDRRDELVLSEVTDDGISHEANVVSIEILGIDG